MLRVKLDTGFNIEVDLPISPFYRRMLAYFIDALLMILYYNITVGILETYIDIYNGKHIFLLILISLPILFYYPVLEILTDGQTVGKKIMGIRVITLEGGQASVSQYLLRWIFRTIDFPIWIFFSIRNGVLPWYSSIFLFSGIACVVISKNAQRIGDIVAGTIVIFTRSKSSWQDTVFTEVGADYRPLYPKVMQMSDKDINSLKMIIDTVNKNNNHDLALRIAERIKSKLAIQSDQDSLDFLETLLKDYNYYSSH